METLAVATICTGGRLKEFAVTKSSLEQFHRCHWLVMTDRRGQQLIKQQYPEISTVVTVEAEASHIRGEYSPFLRMVMEKMAVTRACIRQHGSCLLIDSDLIFTAPLPVALFEQHETVVSDHHLPNRPEVTAKYGRYNVGMIFFRDERVVNAWEEQTRLRAHDTCGLEQKPLELALEALRLPFGVFPETVNVGWWRTYEQGFLPRLESADRGVFLDGHPVTNFHVHLERGVQRGEEQPFADLVRRSLLASRDPLHQATAAVLRSEGLLS